MRRRRWAVVTVCGVLTLVGCGDGSSAQPTTPAVRSSAPTPAPSPDPTVEPAPAATDWVGVPLVPPERPAAMDNDDAAGAQAAAEYFVELYGYALQSQDLVDFTALCDPSSQFCDGVLTDVGAAIDSGQTTVGGDTRLSVQNVQIPGEHPFYVIRGQVDQDSLYVHETEMQVVSEAPGVTDIEFVVAIEFLGPNSWVVRAAESGAIS